MEIAGASGRLIVGIGGFGLEILIVGTVDLASGRFIVGTVGAECGRLIVGIGRALFTWMGVLSRM
jgi:hypothetical protein